MVYDCGTIKRCVQSCFIGSSVSVDALTSISLSKYLVDTRHGRVAEREDEAKFMLDLVSEYGAFTDEDGNTVITEKANGLESRPHDGDVVVRVKLDMRGLTGKILIEYRSSQVLPALLALIS